jgi:hypothetical protein
MKKGYAYPSDAYISEMLGIQPNHVQAALTTLERDGTIVRASTFMPSKGDKPQRRIWPSSEILILSSAVILSPDMGLGHQILDPQILEDIPPINGGQIQ